MIWLASRPLPQSPTARQPCDWPGHRQHVDKAMLQRRLNRFFTSCPEITSIKDILVGGKVVGGLPFAAAGGLANGGWEAATLGPCRLMSFRRFLSSRITVGGGVADAWGW